MTDELRKDDEPVKIPEVLPVLPLRDMVVASSVTELVGRPPDQK